MISVVCVYNNVETLTNCLISSLNSQSKEFDLCLVDNTQSEFKSAAIALNYGAQKAKGDWLLFVHQDVSFLSPDWLEKTENLLNNFNPKGWIGSAGVTSGGVYKAFMRDSEMLFGTPFEGLSEVQTLDECVLICANQNKHKYFDELLEGWHQYGVDVCCQSILEGNSNFVLPFPIWHNSKRVNIAGLRESRNYILHKYQTRLEKIFTTCGVLPDGNILSLYQRIKFRLDSLRFKVFDYKEGFSNSFHKQLEDLTRHFQNILCLHSAHSQSLLITNSFTQFTENPRRIAHSFTGFGDESDAEAQCIVIERDLANGVVENIAWLKEKIKLGNKVLICVNIKEVIENKSRWNPVIKLADEKYMSIDINLERIFILKFWKD